MGDFRKQIWLHHTFKFSFLKKRGTREIAAGYWNFALQGSRRRGRRLPRRLCAATTRHGRGPRRGRSRDLRHQSRASGGACGVGAWRSPRRRRPRDYRSAARRNASEGLRGEFGNKLKKQSKQCLRTLTVEVGQPCIKEHVDGSFSPWRSNNEMSSLALPQRFGNRVPEV